jgi:hypothetical protein
MVNEGEREREKVNLKIRFMSNIQFIDEISSHIVD